MTCLTYKGSASYADCRKAVGSHVIKFATCSFASEMKTSRDQGEKEKNCD